MTCTATYTLTQADVDRGSVNNSATATGIDPVGDPVVSAESTATIDAALAAPELSLVKSVTPSTGVAIGDRVTYSFRVTNTGTVTVTGITVNEGAFSGSGTLSSVDCPGSVTLMPGESTDCTATYVLTTADAAGRQRHQHRYRGR